ncbi:GIY-YIG nuclease family protein [Fluoribacter dumoffii]|uniref:GIY-YIG nuclease family protein n=1 Tax=Fluoribacter dumoffii TaxID=463 RepID=UPI00026C7710|nr:GIY-YIG nuclease family protein [Fluoribacter dumoffii]
MDKIDLLKLIEDDELDLLKVQKKKSSVLTSDERLVDSFHDINEFISKHGREPKPGSDVHEHRLYARLKGIRESKEKIRALLDLDEFGLLKQQEMKEIKSIQDIFEDDSLNLLKNDAENIFEIKHVPKTTTMPSYIASRKPCSNFNEYQDKFFQCQSEIASGVRKLWPFNKEQQIEKGLFFVLKGVLLYIADIGEREIIGGRPNARLHCIFENGTESDMLLRSLAAELYKDGRRVTETQETIISFTPEDEKNGYIYILRSLSEKPEIKAIKNLYKIGFSKITIEERIKNAILEPTYLMSNVSIVAAYECYNMNPQKLEQLLHRFFGKACLDIDVFDSQGQRHVPREWFIAPLEVIEQAIHLLINGDIINYYYDSDKQIIIGR